MVRSMRLFLIRHGETVDNVAQVYAGSRDSELTNHGYQQATRLGTHFQTIGLTFTHLFSSPLQRAAKTADKIREAQARGNSDGRDREVPDVVQLPLLMEQDFGSMEGKKWYDRPPESDVSGKEHQRLGSKETGEFVDMESKDSLARRADAFLEEHLFPLMKSSMDSAEAVVAIVSHGIFLSTLWKRLLSRLAPKSVTLSPELQATARPSLEHLGGWSNTGFLELHMRNAQVEQPQPIADAALAPGPEQSLYPAEMQATNHAIGKIEVSQAASSRASIAQQESLVTFSADVQERKALPSRIAHGWTTTILMINGKDHLKRLKRTGGGVGSSRHDASQKSIETFFKRRKVE